MAFITMLFHHHFGRLCFSAANPSYSTGFDQTHEVPKDENAPMPHAHVGTELVYATDRADLEPPFKVRYLGWLPGCDVGEKD